MTYEIRMIEAKIGMQSLIGASGKPPLSWGNYFTFREGTRCANMWAENLKALVEGGYLLDGKVKCAVWSQPDPNPTRKPNQFAIVIDERIPKEWLYQRLCFTGGWGPTVEVAREMFELIGDPDGELEHYTDPVSYYAKRGDYYDPKTGIVRRTWKPATRHLKANWTIEAVEDLPTEIDPALADEITAALFEEMKKHDR